MVTQAQQLLSKHNYMNEAWWDVRSYEDAIVAETQLMNGFLYIKAFYVYKTVPRAVQAYYPTRITAVKAKKLGITAGLEARLDKKRGEFGAYIVLPNKHQVHVSLGSRVPEYIKELEIPQPNTPPGSDSKAFWKNG